MVISDFLIFLLLFSLSGWVDDAGKLGPNLIFYHTNKSSQIIVVFKLDFGPFFALRHVSQEQIMLLILLEVVVYNPYHLLFTMLVL